MTKATNKYVSVSNDSSSLKYREIANIMTARGDKMNHATVRNIILRGFTKVAKGISKDYGIILDDESAFKIAKSPDFQQAVVSLIKENGKGSLYKWDIHTTCFVKEKDLLYKVIFQSTQKEHIMIL